MCFFPRKRKIHYWTGNHAFVTLTSGGPLSSVVRHDTTVARRNTCAQHGRACKTVSADNWEVFNGRESSPGPAVLGTCNGTVPRSVSDRVRPSDDACNTTHTEFFHFFSPAVVLLLLFFSSCTPSYTTLTYLKRTEDHLFFCQIKIYRWATVKTTGSSVKTLR